MPRPARDKVIGKDQSWTLMALRMSGIESDLDKVQARALARQEFIAINGGMAMENNFREADPVKWPVKAVLYSESVVRLFGRVDATGATPAATLVASLPAEIAPRHQMIFPGWFNNNFTGTLAANQYRITVNTNGRIKVANNVAGVAGGFFSLDGITFTIS